MVKRFPKPDVTLGQHVMPLSAGRSVGAPGPCCPPATVGR